MNYTILEKLSNVSGASGSEQRVAKLLSSLITNKNVIKEADGLGSQIYHFNLNNKPKVQIIAHMDEIGLLISEITNEGYLKFIPLGGWLSTSMLAQEWEIVLDNGKVITAITGAKPPHAVPVDDRNKPLDVKNFFLDIGITSKEEVLDAGIRLGLTATPKTQFSTLTNPNYLTGKAFDDRMGCALEVELINNINIDSLKCNPYFTFSSQEEVGVKGGKTSSYKVNPDLLIGLDVGDAGDYPLADSYQQQLGRGVQILLIDNGTIPHQGFRNYVIKLAKDHNIPIQEPSLKIGRTDTALAHINRSGIPAINILVPTRYMHSHHSIIHKDDYENAFKLLSLILENLNDEVYQEIIK